MGIDVEGKRKTRRSDGGGEKKKGVLLSFKRWLSGEGENFVWGKKKEGGKKAENFGGERGRKKGGPKLVRVGKGIFNREKRGACGKKK